MNRSRANAASLWRETRLWKRGVKYIAGVDEAGRGPLAGPVVAGAVIFPRGVAIDGVADSKQLTRRQREEVMLEIEKHAVSIGIGIVGHEIVDRINIREASLLAMRKAIHKLHPRPEYLLVDGDYFRGGKIPAQAIVHGDEKCFSIAAASIVAKVTRDKLMEGFHVQFPGYGFDRHKGYATSEHIRALEKLGQCEIHRRSFHVHGVDAHLSSRTRPRGS